MKEMKDVNQQKTNFWCVLHFGSQSIPFFRSSPGSIQFLTVLSLIFFCQGAYDNFLKIAFEKDFLKHFTLP